MRVRTLVLAFVLASIFVGSTARAEKVKTNQAAKIYARPGEHGKVIKELKEGQTITVLSKDDRWLKVRYEGRTGYLPRSKVDMPAGDEMVVRNTRRRPFVDGRGTKRGFNGEGGPGDRVGEDATGDNAPADDKSDVKPTKKDPSDDDDKPAKKPDKTAKKPAVVDDDDDEPAAKKPADKKTAAKPDDDDDDSKGAKDDSKGADDSQPTVHVSSKIEIHDEADPESGVAFTANPSDPLYLSDEVDKATKGKWTFVSSKEGDAGYVLTSDLDLHASEPDAPVGPRTREIALRARLGIALLSESMASTGATAMGGPDSFNSGANAVTLALGGSYTRPYGAKYVIGADVNLDLDKALSGLPGTDVTTMMASNAGFTMYNFNLHALGGYDLHGKRGTVFWARLGYHYQSFLVADATDPAKNTTHTPSEVVKGPTLGLAMTVPNLTQKFGFAFNFDLMFAGSLDQTKNLEDGQNPSAGMYGLGLGITYRWRPPMNFQFNYDYESQSLSWGAPVTGSMRTHTGMSAARSDSLNTITFGIVRGF